MIENFDNPYLAGKFSGNGQWTDIAGDSKRYRIDFLEFGEANGLLTLDFVHDLYEEDDQVIAKFAFEFADPNHFSVCTTAEADRAKLGSGHAFDNYCQYMLVIGEMVVETRMVFVDGGLRIFGSSSKNQQGRFIWWEETLRPA